METWPNHITDEFRQFDWHFGIFWIPLVMPVPIAGQSVHASGGDHLMPETGSGTSQSNQWTVIADCHPVVSRGHECQKVRPHWNIGPVLPIIGINILTPFLIDGSSTKCYFAVGSVRCQDGPIAVSLFKKVGLNWSCQDIAGIGFYLPTCVVKNCSTVDIGFTLGDLAASLFCAAFDSLIQSAIDALLGKFFDSEFFKKLFDKVLKAQYKALLRAIELPLTFNERTSKAFIDQLLGRGPVQFSSMAQEMFENVLSLCVGDATDGARAILPMDEFVTGDDGLANRLGAYIDGNSEALGY